MVVRVKAVAGPKRDEVLAAAIGQIEPGRTVTAHLRTPEIPTPYASLQHDKCICPRGVRYRWVQDAGYLEPPLLRVERFGSAGSVRG